MGGAPASANRRWRRPVEPRFRAALPSVDVLVLVAPLPVIALFPLAGSIPLAISLVMFLQILMPRPVLGIVPLVVRTILTFVVFGMVLSKRDAHRQRQPHGQNQGARNTFHSFSSRPHRAALNEGPSRNRARFRACRTLIRTA